MRHSRIVLCLSILATGINACSARRPLEEPSLQTAARTGDALNVADALEKLIEEGRDSQADRESALSLIQGIPAVDTAADHFARASVIGRVVQGKGLLAATQLVDAETEARRSAELDPNFRSGAAQRMLGTLYVIAPARLLKHGNSEIGLEILEDLTRAHPETMENHLRLAEAYMVLHDPDPARAHLCIAQGGRAALRADDQDLLDQLIREATPLGCK